MATEINAQNISAVLNEYIAENLRNNGMDVRRAVSDAMRMLKEQIERSPPVVFMPWVCPGCGMQQPAQTPQCLTCASHAPPNVRQPLRVQFTEESYEVLCKNIQEGVERYQVEKERGAVPIGQGVYAQPIHDDDYAEVIRRAGLG